MGLLICLRDEVENTNLRLDGDAPEGGASAACYLNMTKMIPIKYREFYDIPRMIYFVHEGQAYLLDCPFDDVADQYKEYYIVYAVPNLSVEELSGPWKTLPMKATAELMRIKTEEVNFDASRRESISDSIIEKLKKRI